MADVYSIVVEFLQKGGVFIFPISLVFVIGLAIAIERWLYLQYEKSRNSKAFKDFLPLLSDNDIEKMKAYTRENTAPVIRLIGCGLDMINVSRQRADVENAMSEGMLETMPRLEQRTNYLGLLANVATLLGLLGTIIGLIGAFEAVAKADPSEKSQLLSTSISVAMNTTAVGLISAIPLLILSGLLQNKTKSIVTSIEMSAVKFLNVMTMHRLIEAGTPRVTGDSNGGGALAANSSDSSSILDNDEPHPEALTSKARQSKKESGQLPLAERLKQAETAPTPVESNSEESAEPEVNSSQANSLFSSHEVSEPEKGTPATSNFSVNPEPEEGIQVPVAQSLSSDQRVTYSHHPQMPGSEVNIPSTEEGQFVSAVPSSEIQIPVPVSLGDGVFQDSSANGENSQIEGDKTKLSNNNNNLASGTN